MILAETLIPRGVVVMMASLLTLSFGPAGCSGDSAKAPAAGVDTACPSGEVRSPEGECECLAATVPLAAGGCQPAGLPLDMPCPPGEMPLSGGGCEPAGVATEACGEGFEPDGKRGCNAIMPEEDCPEGLMAVPGETKCREVAPCGSGTWGDIPVEADTEFVDGSYSGADSDGTKEKPWTTIQGGIDGADEGAIVAVAAGSYKESLLLASKPVRLWGRCPSMVEVEGAPGKQSTIEAYFSDGAEVRGLAVRGPGFGLLTRGSTGVIADQVWVHHTGDEGVHVENDGAPTSMTVSSSLIEAIPSTCVIVYLASLTVERSVLRDTTSPEWGPGVVTLNGVDKGASVTVRGSVISRTQGAGVFSQNSSVQIDTTLIRDTQPLADGTRGEGVVAPLDGMGANSGALTIRTSVIEDTRRMGVLGEGLGVSIEATVIRRTRPDKAGNYGRGVSVENDLLKPMGRGALSIRGSLVEGSYGFGIAMLSSDAIVEGTIVRDTEESMKSSLGVGVFAGNDKGERTIATIRGSVIERSAAVGIGVSASDVTIEGSLIADTKLNKEGRGGNGISIQTSQKTLEPASAVVRSCLIERSVEAGVVVMSSDAIIETSHVRDTEPSPGGSFGDGIMVVSQWSLATAQLYGTLVESSSRAGIASFGGQIELTRMAVTCGALDIDGETLNDYDFGFNDLGGMACGCPAATDRCHVQSSGLHPPPALTGF